MYLRFRELISDRLPYWGLPADLSARTPSACRGNLGGESVSRNLPMGAPWFNLFNVEEIRPLALN